MQQSANRERRRDHIIGTCGAEVSGLDPPSLLVELVSSWVEVQQRRSTEVICMELPPPDHFMPIVRTKRL